MKLARLDVAPRRVPLTTPYRIAGRTFDTAEMIFVVMVDEAGLAGYGSASPVAPLTGDDYDSAARTLEGSARPALVVSARVDLVFRRQFTGCEIHQPHLDALIEDTIDLGWGDVDTRFQQAGCQQHILLHVQPRAGGLARLQRSSGHRYQQRAHHADRRGEKHGVASAVTLQHGASSA